MKGYFAFDKVLLRCPSLPLNQALDKNLFHDDKTVHSGIYLSSPALWASLSNFEKLDENQQIKAGRSLLKYLLRSSTRCTPFGLFAGSSLINVDSTTDRICANIRLNTAARKQFIRIDCGFFNKVVSYINNIPEVKNQVKYFLNDTLYEIDGQYRYVSFFEAEGRRNYYVASICKTNELISIFDEAQNGKTISEIAQKLERTNNYLNEKICDYIDELVREKLLVSELDIQVTGEDPLSYLLERLLSFKRIDYLTDQLNEIRSLLHRPQYDLTYYRELEEKIKKICLYSKESKNILQVDLYLETPNSQISKRTLATIVEQIGEVSMCYGTYVKQDIEDFKEKFIEKYDAREIPLSVALDKDIGIEYNTQPTVLEEKDRFKKDAAFINNLSRSQAYVLKKYTDHLKDGTSHIEIREEEIQLLNSNTKNYRTPSSLYVIGSLLKNLSASECDFTFSLSGINGPSAANLMGRFAAGNDAFETFVKEIVSCEEENEKDCIYAEIVHLPDAKTGNVVLRPIFRKYEIPYFAGPRVQREDQISVQDILVCVYNNEIILKSKKHNKRIIPRLTTAHNYKIKSLPVYKFLCELQSHNNQYAILWDWGNLKHLKHYPRVVYKNLIIKKAQWLVELSDLKDLPKDKDEYVHFFAQFRTKYNLDRQVLLVEGDNQLLIDLNDIESIELFLYYINKNKTLLLEEFLFTEDNCVVKDELERPYTNEILIPLRRETRKNNTFFLKNDFDSHNIKRKFTAQSEWLYFKVYCGVSYTDVILKELIYPFVNTGIHEQAFENFFFRSVPRHSAAFENSFLQCGCNKAI